MLSLVLVMLLAACGSESGPEEDRRFANDPATEAPAEPTDMPVTPDGVVASEVVPTALPPDAAEGLLESSGAPAGVMQRDGNLVFVVDPALPGQRTEITFGESGSLLDFAPSPSGGRVAGLVLTSDGELVVELRNTRNEVIDRWRIEGDDAPSATPAAAVGTEAGFAISWTGSTDRVLVTVAGSRVVSVDFAEGQEEVAIPDGFGQIIEASWSPTGDRIAMFGIGPSGAGTIWTVSPYVDGESFRQVIPPAADASNLGSVTQYAWLADGSGFLYILAQDASATNPGGNLYRLDLASRQRQIVATPGRGGPTAQIVDFAVSPDGASVSYVIASPSDDDWLYHSLWIRSLTSALYLQVDRGGSADVTGMWWAGSGFTWRTPTAEGPELIYQDRRTPPTLIWQPQEAMLATPVATPMTEDQARPVFDIGTPSATPEATPMADHAATPVGTPSASPGASPAS